MNWRHGIHPNNYAIGETEKYYSDMSEKGWELVKCGITLSRFQKTEPKKMRYRVEVVNLKSLEDGHLPEEQIAVYEHQDDNVNTLGLSSFVVGAGMY